MNNEDYIQQWLDGTLSDEQKKNFAQRPEYNELEKLNKALYSFGAPEFDVEKEYQYALSKKMSGAEARIVKMNWIKPLLKIAAILCVATGIYLVFVSDRVTTIKTMASENSSVFLPDSSNVILNALSEVSFQQGSWKSKRQVELKGEAFFKVAKGSRFDVKTSSGVVSVLGTQFNVKVREHFFEVTCYEGLVQVQDQNYNVKLQPGKVFRIINGSFIDGLSTAKITSGWLSHESEFESVPFSEVIDEFERQYNVTIQTKNVNIDQLFSGRFGHSDMDVALKSITIPLKLNYQIEDKKNVVLAGELN